MMLNFHSELWREKIPERYKHLLEKHKQVVLPIVVEDVNGNVHPLFWDETDKIWWYTDDNDMSIGCELVIVKQNQPKIKNVIDWRDL